jgi:gamma-glutamyl:cysteine ligase YbdK (ATP-grasp superfamily)
MGVEIERDQFDEADFRRFSEKLRDCLDALKCVLGRPGFGQGEPSIGFELELNLVNGRGRPAPINERVLAEALDDRLSLEVDRFNMEINGRPVPLRGRPFTRAAQDLAEALQATERAAGIHNARVVTIGILPTLSEEDLTSSSLTEGHRYRMLSESLRRIRGEPFPLSIRGQDELSLNAHDVTYEGANTSFQVHLRTTPDQFASTYNAAQIATGIVLAASGNSPLFMNRRLWEETRIALFRQSVDDRVGLRDEDWRPARVSFGHGWVRVGALELFQEAVHLHEPLLPATSMEVASEIASFGAVPKLAELRLHNGTVWRWNRAVYDDADGGHLRVEMRALPAGPTVADMVANAAFLVGLTLWLRSNAEELVTQMTFGHARHNFYEAAKRGLDADLLFPANRGPSPELVGARELALRLLPCARRGLTETGVEPDEADAHLAILRARLESGRTGARWQRRAFEWELARLANREHAASTMLARYCELSSSAAPVHSWPLAGESVGPEPAWTA